METPRILWTNGTYSYLECPSCHGGVPVQSGKVKFGGEATCIACDTQFRFRGQRVSPVTRRNAVVAQRYNPTLQRSLRRLAKQPGAPVEAIEEVIEVMSARERLRAHLRNK